MADTVTGPTILQQNDNRVVIKMVVQSDGSGSTTVMGDVSALADACLNEIQSNKKYKNFDVELCGVKRWEW